jgi:hypothetical protein
LIKAWLWVFPKHFAGSGGGGSVTAGATVRDVMAAAFAEDTVQREDGGEAKVRRNPELYDAVNMATEGRDPNKALGWWLRKRRDRVFTVEGKRYRFCLDDGGKHVLNAMDEEPPPF